MKQNIFQRIIIASSCQIVFLFFISQVALAQSEYLSTQWVCKTDGKGWNQLTDLRITKKNNVIGIGNFSDTTSISKTKLVGENDFYVIKFNKDGGLIWQKRFLTPGKCNVTTTEISDNGTISIAGYFSGTLKIGNNKIISKGKESIFFAVLTANGTVEMLKKISGRFIGERVKLQPYKDSSILVSSAYKQNLAIADSSYTNYDYGSSIFMTQFNINSGKLLKVQLIKCTDKVILEDLQAKDTLFFLALSFTGKLSIREKTIISNGGYDGVLLSFNHKANLIDHSSVFSRHDDFLSDITFDNIGNIIVGGTFSGPLHHKKQTLHSNRDKQNVYLAKFSKDLNLLWFDTFGGEGLEYCSDIVTNSNNEVFITGTFNSSFAKQSNDVKKTNDFKNTYIAKYSHDGNLDYIESIKDTSLNYSVRINTDKNFLYLLGNHITNPGIIDKSKSSSITKLFDCSQSMRVQLPNDTTACQQSIFLTVDSTFKEYLWSNGARSSEVKIDSSGIYTITVSDLMGCKSKDSVNVKLDNPLIDLGDNIIAKKGEHLKIFAETENVQSIVWSDGSKGDTYFIDSNIPNTSTLIAYAISAGGCKASDTINIHILLTSQQNQVNVSLFPNPTSDFITIVNKSKFKSYTFNTIEIYSINGSKVFAKKDININTFKLNVKFLKPGTYFAKVSFANTAQLIEFVKK